MGTYRAGVLHHCVSEAVVALCLQLQIVGAFEDHSFLEVAHLLVLIAHRVLAVVGDGLGCLFGQEADEGHLHCDGVRWLIFVAVHELGTKMKQSVQYKVFDSFYIHFPATLALPPSECKCSHAFPC